MIAQITKCPNTVKAFGLHVQLPLFSTDLNYDYKLYESGLGYLSLGSSMRYGIDSNMVRYPESPSKISEDDLKKINAGGDYCVVNDKDMIEFEL